MCKPRQKPVCSPPTRLTDCYGLTPARISQITAWYAEQLRAAGLLSPEPLPPRADVMVFEPETFNARLDAISRDVWG